MINRLGVVIMAALLVLYLAMVVLLAFQLVSTGDPIAIALGVALIVLPLLGMWGLFVELRFGFASARLERMLAAEGPLPLDGLPALPSGRVERSAANELFDQYRAATEADPENWRNWMRLGIVYDGAGDRRRGREAVRKAIRLEAEGQ